MIISERYENGVLNIDTDRIAERCLNGRPLYVRPADAEERSRLMAFLGKEGFRSTENVQDTGYPLAIDLNAKTVSRMGNTVCAAAAAGSGLVMTGKEFFVLYALRKAADYSRVSRTDNA